MSFSNRIRSLAVALAATAILLCLSACKYEIGRPGGSTPTPSPTPTPTPSELSVAAGSAGESEAVPTSASVASATAEYFADVTDAAAEETSVARRALALAVDSPASAVENLREVKKSISAARAAYRKAEAAIFLVDPESAEELRAQPDPLGAGAPGGSSLLMHELAGSIDIMEDLLSRPLDSSVAGNLLAEARVVGTKIGELDRGLRGLAGAWTAGDADNFRGRFFLASPEMAAARVFQGLIAMTGDALPDRIDSSERGPEEISGRLAAVREIYLGRDGGAPALHQLVVESSPLQAALARASIARADALAGVLEVFPDDSSVRTQLAAALDEVTRQLIFAAEVIGIEIVDTEKP